MLVDSPLHTPAGKIIFLLIMAALIYLSGTVWRSWLTPLSNGWIILGGIFFAFLGSIVGLAWLRYLDRREPESWHYWIGALLFALLFTVAPAAFFNDKSPYPLLTVGFVEEFWKVMPLLLLVFFAPAMVNGVRDGLIYGALGGFAFNIVEIANYFLRVSYPEQGIAGLSEQLARLSFWGIGNHVIWSMLVGAGIGLAVMSTFRKVDISEMKRFEKETNEMTQTYKPDYVAALEAVYGPPSQAGFGSAIFAEQMTGEDGLEALAQHHYQEFVGELWQRWGAETWLAPWREVYARPAGADRDIVAELQAIADPSVANSVPMILDVIENAEAGRQALAQAFDAPQVQEVRVYNIGDGEAMSGLIVAGQWTNGEATFLVFLYD